MILRARARDAFVRLLCYLFSSRVQLAEDSRENETLSIYADDVFRIQREACRRSRLSLSEFSRAIRV